MGKRAQPSVLRPNSLREEVVTVGKALAHDSAAKHVSGTAAYVDDILEPEGCLHLAPGLSTIAAGSLKKLDLAAVRAAPGVVAVLTAKDVPGVNDCSPSIGGDPILAEKEILFHGQVLFAVAAETRLPIVLGGVTDDLADPDHLAANRVRIAVQGHAPIAAATQAVHETLKAIVEGAGPRDLKNIASSDLMNRVTRGDAVAGRQSAFLKIGR